MNKKIKNLIIFLVEYMFLTLLFNCLSTKLIDLYFQKL